MGVSDRAVADADAEWKALLRDAPVAKALFSAVQPHFTAAPIFGDPHDDPCCAGRLAFLPGEPELAVPFAPEPRRASGATYSFPGHAATGFGFAPARRSLFKATRAERYAIACYRAIAEAPEGDGHPTAVGSAANSFQWRAPACSTRATSPPGSRARCSLDGTGTPPRPRPTRS